MIPPPRTQQRRKQDALNRLERDTDAWVATADKGSGTPYLVPLSFLWDGSTLLIATPSSSPTSRNLQATGRVRLGIGPTRDLVLIQGAAHALPGDRDPGRGRRRLRSQDRFRPAPAHQHLPLLLRSPAAAPGLARSQRTGGPRAHARWTVGGA
jgi:hypothetical protein